MHNRQALRYLGPVNAGEHVYVVVPAYCEERHIQRTLGKIPGWVSGIVVVDDASPDATSRVAAELQDARVHCVRHQENQGVGAAIYTGYRRALELGADTIVVMAGDDQMDPADLPQVLAPLRAGAADYVKGNRFIHPQARHMPVLRRLGSRFLAFCTSRVAGQRVSDTQCGYTAISRAAAQALDYASMWSRYGYPNDLLLFLMKRGFRVAEVPVRPVYADEASGLRAWHVLSILRVILRRWAMDRGSLPLHPWNTASDAR